MAELPQLELKVARLKELIMLPAWSKTEMSVAIDETNDARATVAQESQALSEAEEKKAKENSAAAAVAASASAAPPVVAAAAPPIATVDIPATAAAPAEVTETVFEAAADAVTSKEAPAKSLIQIEPGVVMEPIMITHTGTHVIQATTQVVVAMETVTLDPVAQNKRQ